MRGQRQRGDSAVSRIGSATENTIRLELGNRAADAVFWAPGISDDFLCGGDAGYRQAINYCDIVAQKLIFTFELGIERVKVAVADDRHAQPNPGRRLRIEFQMRSFFRNHLTNGSRRD